MLSNLHKYNKIIQYFLVVYKLNLKYYCPFFVLDCIFGNTTIFNNYYMFILDPHAPGILNISDITGNSFNVFWEEPSIKNGILQNYSVTVQSKGALYIVPDQCQFNTQPYTFQVLGNETSFLFLNANPYHEYTILVNASTAVGFGPSDLKTLKTLQEGNMPINIFLKNT